MKSLSQFSLRLNNKYKILSKLMSRLTALGPANEPSHKYAHYMFIDATYTSQAMQGGVFMVRENIEVSRSYDAFLCLFFLCVDGRIINFL